MTVFKNCLILVLSILSIISYSNFAFSQGAVSPDYTEAQIKELFANFTYAYDKKAKMAHITAEIPSACANFLKIDQEVDTSHPNSPTVIFHIPRTMALNACLNAPSRKGMCLTTPNPQCVSLDELAAKPSSDVKSQYHLENLQASSLGIAIKSKAEGKPTAWIANLDLINGVDTSAKPVAVECAQCKLDAAAAARVPLNTDLTLAPLTVVSAATDQVANQPIGTTAAVTNTIAPAPSTDTSDATPTVHKRRQPAAAATTTDSSTNQNNNTGLNPLAVMMLMGATQTLAMVRQNMSYGYGNPYPTTPYVGGATTCQSWMPQASNWGCSSATPGIYTGYPTTTGIGTIGTIGTTLGTGTVATGR